MRSVILVLLCALMLFADRLVIYNWPDYIDTEILKEFTADTSIEIEYKIFQNNEELIKKLQEDSRFDIVFPSLDYIGRLKALDLIDKLDYSKISTLDNFDPFFLQNPQIKDYALPYFWGSTSIIAQKSLHIRSWNDIFKEELRDSIYMLDDLKDMFLLAHKVVGTHPQDATREDIKKAYDKLLTLAPNIKGAFKDKLDLEVKFTNKDIKAAIVYSGEVVEMLEKNPDLEYIFVDDGAILWMDAAVITKDETNKEAIYKFLNYISSAPIASRNAGTIGYASPIKNIISNNKIINPAKDDLKNSSFAALNLTKETYDIYADYYYRFLEEIRSKKGGR